MPAKVHFRLDREELQNILGREVDPYSEPNSLLNILKGKEASLWLVTERYEHVKVKGIILGSISEMPGAVELWVENWKGSTLPEPWAIKVLEVYKT